MSDAPLPLFVYGTLRLGEPAFAQVAAFVLRVEPAVLPDAVLYDLGAFPMAVPAEGEVHGELLHLEPRLYPYLLHRLDRYEGYDSRSDSGLFLRRAVEVTVMSGEKMTAWTYLGHAGEVAEARHIAGGDWLRRG